MGEVSESGHLRSENPEHVVALLKRAKVPGYVFPSRNGWVSFVYPPGDENKFDISQENEKLLVFYDYAADHGFSVTVYQAKKPITRIRAAFDRPNSAFDRRPFESLELLTPASSAAIDTWLKKAHLMHERVRAPHLVAERLHLPRFAWFSHLAEKSNANPDPQRIEVTEDGKVKRPPKPVAPHVAVAKPTKTKKRAAASRSKKPQKRPKPRKK